MGQDAAGRDNKGTRCGSDEIWQGPGGGAPGEGESLLALKEGGGGRVSPQGPKREPPASSPSLTLYPHLHTLQSSFPLPLPLTIYETEALCLTLLRPLAATRPLSLFITPNSRQQRLY